MMSLDLVTKSRMRTDMHLGDTRKKLEFAIFLDTSLLPQATPGLLRVK